MKSCKTCDADGRRCRENAPNRKTRGIENADFVLYVSALPTSQCSETIGMYLCNLGEYVQQLFIPVKIVKYLTQELTLLFHRNSTLFVLRLASSSWVF